LAGSGSQFDPGLVIPFIVELKKVGEPQLIIDLSMEASPVPVLETDSSIEFLKAA
jgi:hypothetical protein